MGLFLFKFKLIKIRVSFKYWTTRKRIQATRISSMSQMGNQETSQQVRPRLLGRVLYCHRCGIRCLDFSIGGGCCAFYLQRRWHCGGGGDDDGQLNFFLSKFFITVIISCFSPFFFGFCFYFFNKKIYFILFLRYSRICYNDGYKTRDVRLLLISWLRLAWVLFDTRPPLGGWYSQ